MKNIRNIIVILPLIIIIFFSYHFTYSYSQSINYSDTPRNLYPLMPQENKSLSPIESAYIYSLLRELEDIKIIVSKYNSTLEDKLNTLETLIMKGEYDKASNYYESIKDDLDSLMDYLKDVNLEDYIKLSELLPDRIVIGNVNDLNDLWGYISTSPNLNETINLGGVSLPNNSIAGNFFNPPLHRVTIPTVSPPYLNSPILSQTMLLILLIPLLSLLVIKRGSISNMLGFIREKYSEKMVYPSGEVYLDEVTKKYIEFLSILSKLGFPREEYEGPIEYAERIVDKELREAALKIGMYFERTRYGVKPLTEEELKIIEDIINQVKGRLK